jgi:hypothetical protein
MMMSEWEEIYILLGASILAFAFYKNHDKYESKAQG